MSQARLQSSDCNCDREPSLLQSPASRRTLEGNISVFAPVTNIKFDGVAVRYGPLIVSGENVGHTGPAHVQTTSLDYEASNAGQRAVSPS